MIKKMHANEINKYAKTFINQLIAKKRLSLNTKYAYEQDLSVFLDFYDQFNSNNNKFLEEFYEFIKKQDISNATIARRISTVMQFMNYLNENIFEKLDENFDISNKPNIKSSKTFSAFLESDHLEKLKATLKFSKKDIRINAIIELLYSTGMRISELLSLKVHNLKEIFENNTLLITGKGNHQRFVFFSHNALKALENYLKIYKKDQGYIFSGNNFNKPITRQRVFQLLKELALKAEVPVEIVFPHSLRHRMLTDLVNGNASLVSVQKIAGHKQINTTARYTHIEDTLYDDILKYHPFGHKEN